MTDIQTDAFKIESISSIEAVSKELWIKGHESKGYSYREDEENAYFKKDDSEIRKPRWEYLDKEYIAEAVEYVLENDMIDEKSLRDLASQQIEKDKNREGENESHTTRAARYALETLDDNTSPVNDKGLEIRQLKKEGGKYEVKIDITVDEWKEMLRDPGIFDENSLDMVIKWYYEKDHESSTKDMMTKYGPAELDASPYNGIVVGLATRVLKHLNRFEVIGTDGKTQSKFIIPFEGRDAKGEENGFIWTLRDELVTALEESGLVNKELYRCDEAIDPLSLTEAEMLAFAGSIGVTIDEPSAEDLDEKIREISVRALNKTVKERIFLSKTLERNPHYAKLVKERASYVCEVCGIKGFETRNGGYYAEAHHLDELAKSRIDDPGRMICVCPTCHRVLHHGTDLEIEKRRAMKSKDVQH